MRKLVISRIKFVAFSVLVIALFHFCENSHRNDYNSRDAQVENFDHIADKEHNVIDCYSNFKELIDSFEVNFAGGKRFIYRYQLEFNAGRSKTILPSSDNYFIWKFHGATCTQCSAEPEIVYVAAYGDRVMKLSLENGGILAEGKIPVVGNRAFQEMAIKCNNDKIIVSFKDNLYIYRDNLELVYDYHESEIGNKLYSNRDDGLGKLVHRGDFFFFGLEYELIDQNKIAISGTFRRRNFEFEKDGDDIIDSVRISRLVLDDL